MAIDKVEVEILPVGQGSCNVVKGLNAAGQLEYLAILDAGGDGTSKSPAKEAKALLEKYMKDRAAAIGPTAQTDHYADLLLISHSDSDHYSIISEIVNEKEAHISISSDSTKKKTIERIYSSGKSYVYEFYENIPAEYIYKYISNKGLYEITYLSNDPDDFLENIDFYDGIDKIESLSATHSFSLTYKEKQLHLVFDEKTTFIGISDEYADEHDYEIDIDKTINAPYHLKCVLDFLEKNINSIEDDEPKDIICTIICNLKNAIGTLSVGNKKPLLEINISEIQSKLNRTPPKINTIEFGKVITSRSSNEPGMIDILKLKKVYNIYSTYIELYIICIENKSDNIRFYKQQYRIVRTNNQNFDDHFRNMNSIITVVGITGVGPKYIFPGDATVQNLWYNGINNAINAALIHGNGNNFLALPHHGSHRTSHGEYNDGGTKKTVFTEFLKKADPQYLYVSAGYESHHGHPNIWTMNECAAYLAGKTALYEHIVYYNRSNDSTKNFAFCKYDKPLFGTVTLTADTTTPANPHKIEAAGYRITFNGTTATHDKIVFTQLIPSLGSYDSSKIKTFPGPGGTFPVTAVRTLPNHAVFNFVFKD